jgi:hypothetical protein
MCECVKKFTNQFVKVSARKRRRLMTFFILRE